MYYIVTLKVHFVRKKPNLQSTIFDFGVNFPFIPCFHQMGLNHQYVPFNSFFQTYIGTLLVSVNPYKELDIYNKKQMETYMGINFFELPPHM